MRIVGIEFRPPLAFGRLGAGATPMDNYVWREDPTLHGTARNVIDPAVSFEIVDDGSLMPFLPTSIRFRERGHYRPVAPFFELWASVVDLDEAPEGRGEPVTCPLTAALLKSARGDLSTLVYEVAVANRKAARRTGDESDAFIATAQARADDHSRHRLLASSPALPDSQPLVQASNPVPLGWFQIIRPVPGMVNSVDRDVLRVRFTPAAGEVYGPPGAIQATDPATGRAYGIVAPANRILNPQAGWLRYRLSDSLSPDYYHPEPSDTYDGADQGRQQSWGVVDDTCDGLITANLVIGGRNFSATARICVGPPDFAPDRRPFVSLADDLADRDLEPAGTDELAHHSPAAQKRLADLFQRVWETASLTNLDAIRQRAIGDNDGEAAVKGLPAVNDDSMRPQDTPFADANVEAMIPEKDKPSDALIFTKLVHLAHASLADEDALVRFFIDHAQRLRQLIRPAYGAFEQLQESVHEDAAPAADYRDPRITRDRLHDMRMPPYMRDEMAMALSLTRRQYAELMGYLDVVADVFERRAAALAGTAQITTPLRRRIAARLNMISDPGS